MRLAVCVGTESLGTTALRFRHWLVAVLTPLYESIHHAVASSLEEIAAAASTSRLRHHSVRASWKTRFAFLGGGSPRVCAIAPEYPCASKGTLVLVCEPTTLILLLFLPSDEKQTCLVCDPRMTQDITGLKPV